jgi:hypothetical protein
MKKGFCLILIFLFVSFLLSVNFSYAQEIKVDTIKTSSTRTITIVTIRTLPKFILQFNASYLSGSMELSAHNGGFSSDDFIKGKSFCARNGIGFNLSGKIPLSKIGNFWLDITGNYNRFISNLIANNTASGKVSYNVFGGGVGLDYMFIPTHKVKYFFGVNSLFNVINGNATLINTDAFGSMQTINIKSGFRIGYSVFTGFEISFQKNFGINFGIKYSHLNLLLKSTSPVNVNSETDLNDNAIVPPQVFSGWKQFAYSSFFGGFSYYFGVKELRYKIPEK